MELLTLAIVGAVVSAIAGFVKSKYGASGWRAVLSLVVISLVGGIGYWFLKGSNLLQASAEVLVAANLLYTLLFKQIKNQINN